MNISEICNEIDLSPDKYHLIQYLNNEEFCYSILDIDNQKYVFFQKITLKPGLKNYLNIEEILQKEEPLKRRYNKRYLLHSTLRSTFVPALFFSETNIKTYFQFVHELSEEEELNYSFVSSIKSYNIFSINSEVANIFNKVQKIHIVHSNLVTIETLMNVIKEDNCIYTYFNETIVEVAIKEDNQLRYFNQFLINSEDDFLYYMNVIYEQLKIKKDKLNFSISGNTKFERNIINYIYKYFKKPLILEVEWPELDFKISSLNKYKYFNLFYLYNCELLAENIKEEF